ncbi:hypothetical protein [Arthrobacter castelli]|uniref:hypothetical protein n=1 Tax=Arthrobacter castelli TaxID=271431 RepID=UPI000400001F|nr:hypothetical protein [Arthrobacter castelli]
MAALRALDHAVAMHRGPDAGLALLEELVSDTLIAEDHRLHAVRTHLLEMTGDPSAARESYRAAARRTTNLQQQKYLNRRAARLANDSSYP